MSTGNCSHYIPPICKAKQYPDLPLTAIFATKNEPENKETIVEWKLLTDLSVTSLTAVVEKRKWYGHRWKIQTFHKVMKPGCQTERSRLGLAEQLKILLCCYYILSSRIFWLKMLTREIPTTPVEMRLPLLWYSLIIRQLVFVS